MGISFRDRYVYAVKAEQEDERQRFFAAAESMGIPTSRNYRDRSYVWPRDTCLFAVNPARRQIRYIAEPHICAAMVCCGARIYSVSEFLLLSRLGFPPSLCPVFHVPHDGDLFPDKLMDAVCVPSEQFFRYHEKMRDAGVWDMVPGAYRVPYQTVRFPVSRLLCDVERFIGPEEIMERYGMGYCYDRAFDGTVIKRVTHEIREKTLVYYQRHHTRMDRICEKHGRVLLFDLHSYSDEIMPGVFLREGIPTPDVCVGADPVFTPEKLAAAAEGVFREAGYTTARNYPYSGCYVPNTVMKGRADCIPVMLEFNKRVYCDETGAPVPDALGRLRRLLEQMAAECSLL